MAVTKGIDGGKGITFSLAGYDCAACDFVWDKCGGLRQHRWPSACAGWPLGHSSAALFLGQTASHRRPQQRCRVLGRAPAPHARLGASHGDRGERAYRRREGAGGVAACRQVFAQCMRAALRARISELVHLALVPLTIVPSTLVPSTRVYPHARDH